MSHPQPYKNWTEKELRHTLKMHVSRMNLGHSLEILWKNSIDEAFRALNWSAVNDFNGCTIVQDEFHPSPACFVHDYYWITGHGGHVADNIFYNLMIASGMKKGKAFRRWLGVRIGWYAFYLWRYIIKRNYMRPTSSMVALHEHFKHYKK